MDFTSLTRLIKDLSSLKKDFYTISKELENKIFAISNTDLKNIISEIGINLKILSTILLKKNYFQKLQILYWQKLFKNLV